MPIDADDFRHMALALQLAERGLYTADPNPRVGCVLTDSNGLVVGRGFHVRAGEAHAEVNAIKDAGGKSEGATAYVSLEPCCHHGRTPPCSEALIEAGVSRVVYAMADPDPRVAGGGRQQLLDAGIEVEFGVLEAEAIELNRGFASRLLCGRPLVRTKIAASLDGRTALANGTSQWITGPEARADVHRWRARSSAILSGIDTVLADDPSLNVRLEESVAVQQPIRVIADSGLRTPIDAKLFGIDGPILIAHLEAAASAELAKRATLISLPADGAGRVALPELLSQLAAQDVNEVLVEAGPTLNGALLDAGLIDEVLVYMAPMVLGNAARGMFDTQVIESMQARYNLELTDVRQLGADLRLHYRVVDEGSK